MLILAVGRGEKTVKTLKSLRPVIIVRIYYGERPCAHRRTRAKHGVRGAERLFAPFWEGYALRQHGKLLIGIINFDEF